MDSLQALCTALAAELIEAHQAIADEATTTEAERKAHQATINQLTKAAFEFAGGNLPRQAGPLVLVSSRTAANVVYSVNPDANTCTCRNGRACWHIAAAQVFLAAKAEEAKEAARVDDMLDEVFDAIPF